MDNLPDNVTLNDIDDAAADRYGIADDDFEPDDSWHDDTDYGIDPRYRIIKPSETN